VIITNIRIFRYQLPFKSTMRFTGHELTKREGYIVALETDQGLTGYGEIAPLPGLHKESLEECFKQLQSLLPILLPKSFDFEEKTPHELMLNWLDSYQLHPSLHFGLDMATIQLSGLFESAFSQTEILRIPVNALIEADMALIERKTPELIESGYRTIKMKIGRKSLDDDIAAVKRLMEIAGKEVKIRLDVNRLWSLEAALTFSNIIDVSSLDYIEEPLNNPQNLQALYERTQMPIALDETLAEYKLNLEELPFGAPKTFIIKPSALGKLSYTFTLHDIGMARNISCVLTSAFESGLSHQFFAWLAKLNSPKNVASGLDTINYFNDDILLKPFAIQHGFAEVSLNDLTHSPLNFEKLTELPL